MQLHKGYWVSGSAVPGPPYTTYWEILGTVLKPHHGGSVVEVGRFRLPKFTVEIKERAEWFGIGSYPAVSWSCHAIGAKMAKENKLRDRIEKITATIHQLQT